MASAESTPMMSRCVPLSGSAGGAFAGDVLLPNGWRVECKARADGWATLWNIKSGRPVALSGRESLPLELRSRRPHTHRALNDAIEQAEIFATIREQYSIARDDNLQLRDFPTQLFVVAPYRLQREIVVPRRAHAANQRGGGALHFGLEERKLAAKPPPPPLAPVPASSDGGGASAGRSGARSVQLWQSVRTGS